MTNLSRSSRVAHEQQDCPILFLFLLPAVSLACSPHGNTVAKPPRTSRQNHSVKTNEPKVSRATTSALVRSSTRLDSSAPVVTARCHPFHLLDSCPSRYVYLHLPQEANGISRINRKYIHIWSTRIESGKSATEKSNDTQNPLPPKGSTEKEKKMPHHSLHC